MTDTKTAKVVIPPTPPAKVRLVVPKFVLSVMFILIFGLLGTSLYDVYMLNTNVFSQTAPKTKIMFLTKMGVNDRALEMIRAQLSVDLYKFYDRYTADRNVTFILLTAAMLYKIPIHYLFALAWRESQFNPRAINSDGNADGSVDYGLLQLNSKTFAMYPKEYLMDLANNVRLGCEKLVENYNTYGNWYEAIMAYNGGSTTTVKNRVIKHMVAVMDYAGDMDVKFSEIFG